MARSGGTKWFCAESSMSKKTFYLGGEGKVVMDLLVWLRPQTTQLLSKVVLVSENDGEIGIFILQTWRRTLTCKARVLVRSSFSYKICFLGPENLKLVVGKSITHNNSLNSNSIWRLLSLVVQLHQLTVVRAASVRSSLATKVAAIPREVRIPSGKIHLCTT